MFCISPAKKRAGKHCCAYGCSNKPAEKKGGLCHKHYTRKTRLTDPVQERYHDFKGNSKKRGIPNSITLEQFRDFCKRTGYIVTKGRRGYNATIDKIRNKEGYHIDNIQLLTNKQNASKGAKDLDDVPF